MSGCFPKVRLSNAAIIVLWYQNSNSNSNEQYYKISGLALCYKYSHDQKDAIECPVVDQSSHNTIRIHKCKNVV